MSTGNKKETGYEGLNLKDLYTRLAKTEDECKQLRKLVADMLAVIDNARRGFNTHPKTYRDLYSRAKKLNAHEVTDE